MNERGGCGECFGVEYYANGKTGESNNLYCGTPEHGLCPACAKLYRDLRDAVAYYKRYKGVPQFRPVSLALQAIEERET